MENIKAIIFDMDGVLFDTETFYYRRREMFLAKKGISIKHLSPSFFIGGNTDYLWQEILQDDYDKWNIEQLQTEYIIYKSHHPLPYKELIFPDTVEVIKNLYDKGYRLAIASNSAKSDIIRALENTKIREYFSVILSGDEVLRGKPYPDVYQEAVSQLAINSDSVVVIEDSTKGIEAGISAGLQVWAIEDKLFGMNQTKAHRLVKNLTQVFEDVVG